MEHKFYRVLRWFVLILVCVAWLGARAHAASILFDNSKNEQAGNADWVIDDNFPNPIPSVPTKEDDWRGAYSSWGFALYQSGHSLKTLSPGASITYGDSMNAQDLSHFDLFVVPEPQNYFSSSEKTAIVDFVNDGGGLFIIANHWSSDRDGDSVDSPMVWNDLGTKIYFGMEFDHANVSDVSSNRLLTHPIVQDTEFGAVTTLKFSAGNTLTLYPTNNATVQGVFWQVGSAQGTTDVMAASCSYGAGRVVAVGDSSPADDGTGAPGNDLYDGWNDAAATDAAFFLSATQYLLGTSQQNTSPTISNVTIIPPQPNQQTPVYISAIIEDTGGLVTSATVYYRVPPAVNFDSVAMGIISGDASSGTWKTIAPIPAFPSGTTVEFYLYAQDNGVPPASALSPPDAPTTLHSYQVTHIAHLDLSGWKLVQYNADAELVLPAGTIIQPMNYLIISRDSSQAAFQSFWGVTLAPQVTFIQSTLVPGASSLGFPRINGDEYFELRNASDVVIDGPTVSITANQCARRINPGDPAGIPGSWTIEAASEATPGSGAGTSSGAGCVINEFSDALGSGNFIYEFIELFYDSGGGSPPEITSVSEDSGGRTLIFGDTLTVTMEGDAGCSATFDLDDVVVRHAMAEISTGLYRSSYVVPWGVRIRNAVVTGRLDNAYGETTLAAPTTVSIDSGESLAHVEFASGCEGWTSGSATMVFTAPLFSWSAGALHLGSQNNTATFGYWQSPTAFPIVRDSVYEAICRIATTLSDRSRVPEIRLRMNVSDLQQNAFLSINSVGAGDSSPDTAGAEYCFYFHPNFLSEGKMIGVAFDLLNFSPDDAPDAVLSLEDVEVLRFSREAFDRTATLANTYDFTTSTQGWTFAGAPAAFPLPSSNVSAGALELIATGNTANFGYWFSGYDVAAAPGKIYRATFSVRTDTTQASAVAECRLRLSSENNQFSTGIGLDSVGDGESTPRTQARDYEVYALPPAEALAAPDNHLSFAFDLLNFDPSDSASSKLALDGLTVEEMIPPAHP